MHCTTQTTHTHTHIHHRICELWQLKTITHLQIDWECYFATAHVSRIKRRRQRCQLHRWQLRETCAQAADTCLLTHCAHSTPSGRLSDDKLFTSELPRTSICLVLPFNLISHYVASHVKSLRLCTAQSLRFAGFSSVPAPATYISAYTATQRTKNLKSHLIYKINGNTKCVRYVSFGIFRDNSDDEGKRFRIAIQYHMATECERVLSRQTSAEHLICFPFSLFHSIHTSEWVQLHLSFLFFRVKNNCRCHYISLLLCERKWKQKQRKITYDDQSSSDSLFPLSASPSPLTICGNFNIHRLMAAFCHTFSTQTNGFIVEMCLGLVAVAAVCRNIARAPSAASVVHLRYLSNISAARKCIPFPVSIN